MKNIQGWKGFNVSFRSVTSYLPMMATASASMCPLLIQSSAACRIELQYEVTTAETDNKLKYTKSASTFTMKSKEQNQFHYEGV